MKFVDRLRETRYIEEEINNYVIKYSIEELNREE